MPSNDGTIQITRRAVLEIIRMLENLFRDGTGIAIGDQENEPDLDLELGAIDEVETGTVAWTFMNNTLFAMRFIIGILNSVLDDASDSETTTLDGEEI